MIEKKISSKKQLKNFLLWAKILNPPLLIIEVKSFPCLRSYTKKTKRLKQYVYQAQNKLSIYHKRIVPFSEFAKEDNWEDLFKSFGFFLRVCPPAFIFEPEPEQISAVDRALIWFKELKRRGEI